MTDIVAPSSAQEFWESFYRERDQVWSGNPNPLLVREAAELTPGTALDLGCGEGGDAIWLAGRGWRVRAVDISATALGRAAAHAEAAGVGDRIEWAEHDLDHTFPEGVFDLVSAQFFHSPVAGADDRTQVLSRAAEAVAVDGVLLIGGHAGWPSFAEQDDTEHDHAHSEHSHGENAHGEHSPAGHDHGEHDHGANAHPDVHFPTLAEVTAGLATAPGQWRIETSEEVESDMTWPDGRIGRRRDIVLRLRRTA